MRIEKRRKKVIEKESGDLGREKNKKKRKEQRREM